MQQAGEELTSDKQRQKEAVRFFNSRNLLNGLYILLFSADRGVVVYTPVIILGLAGIGIALKKNIKLTALGSAIVGVNIVIYALWGDPWGGWAFGTRYLIPAFAVLAVYLALFLSFVNKRTIVYMVFWMLFVYSGAINTVGAITTSSVPPKIEILALEEATKRPQKYTFEKNYDLLGNDLSKSFLFRMIANKYLTAWQYYSLLTFLVLYAGSVLLITDYLKNKDV